jgi:hypothetical protein
MSAKRKDLTAILLLLLVTATIVFICIKPVIEHPNNYLFSHGGDAVKSYFNFAYYLKYDSGLKHDGINYPYGDHLQYINSHPFHAAVCKLIDPFFPIAPYGVAIINLLMVTAFLLAIPFLYLILRHFKLPVWYSFVVALIILFLSPQLDRVKGHFEMAYLYFIPMYWYFLLKYKEGKKRWLWTVLLVGSGIIGGFTSAYFASFYSLLLWAVLLAELWFNRKNLKGYSTQGLYLFIMAIIPLVIVRGLVGATDWVDARPTNPWGFYVFHANLFSIFLPGYNFIHQPVMAFFNASYEWEGRAYVGLPATILAIALLITSLYYLFTKKRNSTLFYTENWNVFLLGAALVLLFSMCIPFKYGFGGLLQFLGPVKQFRALGRFAWIFYYIFTVFTAYYIYHFASRLREKGWRKISSALLLIALITWAFDAYTNASRSFNGIFLKNNLLEASDAAYQKILTENNITSSDYQAIFFLPFANTTGDKLSFERGLENAFGEAMRCAYHTGLPLIQSYEPRISFENALSAVQLLADSTIKKTRLADMNNKPILLVSTPDKLNKNEQWLKDKSQTLYADERITLSKVDVKVFQESHQNWLEHATSIEPQLSGNKDIKADIPLTNVLFLDFDELNAEHRLAGAGAKFQRRKTMEVFNENFAQKGMTGSYRLSFWLFFDTRIYDMPLPKIRIKKADGNTEQILTLNNRSIHNVYQQWVCVEQTLNFEEDKTYALEITGRYITIDNLLLQPTNSNVWCKTSDGKTWLNNFALD